ncbi:uncharacterized protein LOC121735655 [Aricia agestis]|uniref:uncharacterized protein LOC121735655 n=1 Tax=Aricia agestis TaxID=91739 RepID=UPI001C20851B|nr:uncharacterized protein LOC121735655 [Aricia agestis]
MGDFNARVGTKQIGEENILGMSCFGKRDKRGSMKKGLKELNASKKWVPCLQESSQKNKKTFYRTEIVNIATEFYKDLYSKKTMLQPSVLSSNHNNHNTVKRFTFNEIASMIKRLKKEKSSGPDGIPNEAILAGKPTLVPLLTTLFNMILDTKTIPEEWAKSNIILLYKKGNPNCVSNYRPISLQPTLYKLFASGIERRLAEYTEKHQPVEQAGFRSSFSTTDHIHSLEIVIEKYQEMKRPLYLAFIDYAKAFDSISHDSIWRALNECEVPSEIINLIKDIYQKSKSKVILDRAGPEIDIQREKASQLQEMLKEIHLVSYTVGLELNTSKTKIMTNSIEIPIKINNAPIEYVQDYVYLGKQISFKKTRHKEELNRRINTAWKKFWSLKEILKSNAPIRLKKKVMDSCILPSLTYASQTWIYNKFTKNKIITTQRAMERSVLRLRLKHKKKSTDIRHITNVIDALTHCKKLKWKWAGHVARMNENRWAKIVTLWQGPMGKRNRGRPADRWLDEILKIAGKNWTEKAKDRKVWTSMEEAFTL